MRRIVALNLEIVGFCTILIAICGVQRCARVIPIILEGRVEPPLPKPIFQGLRSVDCGSRSTQGAKRYEPTVGGRILALLVEAHDRRVVYRLIGRIFDFCKLLESEWSPYESTKEAATRLYMASKSCAPKCSTKFPVQGM